MYDRTTNDCKLFSGSLTQLHADCREVGYAREPDHGQCDVVFLANSSNGCYVSLLFNYLSILTNLISSVIIYQIWAGYNP